MVSAATVALAKINASRREPAPEEFKLVTVKVAMVDCPCQLSRLSSKSLDFWVYFVFFLNDTFDEQTAWGENQNSTGKARHEPDGIRAACCLQQQLWAKNFQFGDDETDHGQHSSKWPILKRNHRLGVIHMNDASVLVMFTLQPVCKQRHTGNLLAVSVIHKAKHFALGLAVTLEKPLRSQRNPPL
jgi:hypothetical protein